MRKKKVRSWRSTGEEVTLLRTEVVLGWLRVRPWLDEVEEGGVLSKPLLLLRLKKKKGSVRVGHRVQVNKLWLCDGSGQHNLPPHHKPCICLCVWKQWSPNESAAGCTGPSTLCEAAGSSHPDQCWRHNIDLINCINQLWTKSLFCYLFVLCYQGFHASSA